MQFDTDAALKAGYSFSEIASYLGQNSGFDVVSARQAGYGDEEIVTHLTGWEPPRGLLDRVWDATGGAIGRGIGNTSRMVEATGRTYANDLTGVEDVAQRNQVAQQDMPPEQRALMDEIAGIDRDQHWTGQIGDTLGAARGNLEGTGQMVVEQTPNTVVALGSGLAGAKAGGITGGKIGSIFGPKGTVLGAAIGSGVGFFGGMSVGNAALETGGKAMEKAEGGFTPEERGEAIQEGAIKGTVIAAVDTVFFGLGAGLTRAFSAPARNAEAAARARVLADAGVDVSSADAVLRAVTQNPDLMSQAISTGRAAGEQAMSTTRRASIGAGVLTTETLGEGTGDYLGELAATGEADVVDATIESIAGFGQSAATTPFAMRYGQQVAADTETLDNTITPEEAQRRMMEARRAQQLAAAQAAEQGITAAPDAASAIDAFAGATGATSDMMRDVLSEDAAAIDQQMQAERAAQEQQQVTQILDPEQAGLEQEAALLDADALLAAVEAKFRPSGTLEVTGKGAEKAVKAIAPEAPISITSSGSVLVSARFAGPVFDTLQSAKIEMDQIRRMSGLPGEVDAAQVDEQSGTGSSADVSRSAGNAPLGDGIGLGASTDAGASVAGVRAPAPVGVTNPDAITQLGDIDGTQALETQQAESGTPTQAGAEVLSRERTTGEQITGAFDSMGADITGAARDAMAKAVREGDTSRATFSRPESIAAAKANQSYEVKDNPDGTVTVTGVRDSSGNWVRAAQEEVTPTPAPTATPQLTASGKPFKTERAAATSAKQKKLDLVPVAVEGGWGLVPKQAPTVSASRPVILQNRNRATPTSVTQMQNIASAPDYGRLGFSRDFANGAPVVAGGNIPANQVGRSDVAVASDGRRIPVQYAVVEADTVLASNRADGMPNTDYGNQSVDAVRAIAGNGRIAGLQAAYRNGTTAAYQGELTQDTLHGIDPAVMAGMRNPVLVRVMPNEEVTADIGDVSNTTGNLNLSPVEQANNDAERVSLDDLRFGEDGAVTPDTVRQFVRAMPQAEQGALVDTNGQPTKQAVDRLNAAVFSRAYGNDQLVRLFAQAQDAEARNVLSALAQVAPKMARLEGAGALDVRDLVAQAAEIAVNARRDGISLTRAAQQMDMTADPNVGVVLQLFADNARSVRPVVEALGRMADFAYTEATKPSEDMFGPVARGTRQDAINQLRTPDERASQEAVERASGREPVQEDAARRADDAQRSADAGDVEAGRPVEVGSEELTLESYTPAELAERQAAIDATEQAETSAEREAADKERATREREDVRRRSEAAAGSYELGQSAEDNLSGQGPLFSRGGPAKPSKPNRDAEYMAAIERGDMDAAQKLVDQAARDAGYISNTDYRMQHRAPNSEDDVSLADVRAADLVPADYWTTPRFYLSDPREFSAHADIVSLFRAADARRAKGMDPGLASMYVYRAVPKDVKDGSIRNGDWVSPSESYARDEGLSIPGGYRIISQRVLARNLYWDGNSAAELGVDDGSGYAYKNTKNNRKLTDVITRDDDGNIIPLSKRFNVRNDDPRFSFAGPNAATADTMALDTAKSRIESGENAETVRRETGWFKGVDGKWRFEINDRDARLQNLNEEDGTANRATWLAEVLDHPALFAAYPALANIDVILDIAPGLKREGTYTDAVPGDDQYFGRSAEINVSAPDMETALSVLLHEIQHGIQDVEGFATGGSARTFARQVAEADSMIAAHNRSLARISKEIDAAKAERNDAAVKRLTGDYNRTLNLRSELVERSQQDPFQQYQRLAGEVEARNTQTRQGMTDAERQATPPSATADAADADVIVVFNGTEMASAPAPANSRGQGTPATITPVTTLTAAFKEAFPNQANTLDRMIQRGENGQRGGVVFAEDEAALAQAFADKTGRTLEEAMAVLQMSKKAQMPTGPVPEGVAQAASIEAAYEIANAESFKYIRDLKLRIQGAVLEAAGGVDLSAMSPEVRQHLIDMGVSEAIKALENNANAVGWYDEKTRQALSVVALIHPEILTNEDARFAFIYALAVTSNGQKVNKNFELAERAYQGWKDTGRMPDDVGAGGPARKKVHEALARFDALVQTLGSPKAAAEFMLTEFTVKELEAKGLKISGELTDETVLGAAILGPKIGNGFFANLYGVFDQLTMDRWLMRTWGRWTGTLVSDNQKAISDESKVLVAIVRGVRGDAEARTAAREAFAMSTTGKIDKAKLRVFDELVKAKNWEHLAEQIKLKSTYPPIRKRLQSTPLTNELRLSGNRLAGKLDGQNEAPTGGTQRRWIREVFAEVLASVNAQAGVKLTMADLQALIWYPEKRMYDSAKADESLDGYEDNEAPDYANAAAGLARSRGVSEAAIAAALARPADRSSTVRTRKRDVAGAIQGRGSRTEGTDGQSQEVEVQLSKDGTINGFYDPQSGIVFINQSAVTADTIGGVMLHEAMHGGQNSDVDAKAMKMVADRDKASTPATLRPLMAEVAAKMEAAGVANDAREASAYIVEAAANYGRQNGFSVLDGKFMTWLDGKQPRLAKFLRDWIAGIRAWGMKHGINLNPTVDDLVAFSKQSMAAMARGEAISAGTTITGSRSGREGAQADSGATGATGADGAGQAGQSDSASARESATDLSGAGRGDNGDGVSTPLRKVGDRDRVLYAVGGSGTLAQTATAAFKKWFGDSKVVDESGEPLVVYHGTDAEFTVFNQSADGVYGPGSYMTKYDGDAASYGKNVMPVFVSLQNPYVTTPGEARKARKEGGTKAWSESIRAQGYDGIVVNDMSVIVAFEPTQIKSATDNTGTFDGTNPDIRFSRSGGTPGPGTLAQGGGRGPGPQPAAPAETLARKAQRVVQDKLNRFTVIKEWLVEQGVRLSEAADVYKAEERMHSKFANKAEDFRERRLKPLVEKIQKAGFSMDDVAQFLHAQHAEERNIQVAKVNANKPDGGSGMKTAEARTILAAASPELKALSNEVRQITEDSLKMLVDNGILSKDQADAYRKAYSHYVPLKGGPESNIVAGTGKGLKASHKSKRALGHDMREGGEWIIENIVADYERALMTVEKNRVGQSLLKMALEMGRDDIISIGQPEKRQVLRNNTAYEVLLRGQVIGTFNSEEAARVFRQTAAASMGGSPSNMGIRKTSDPMVVLMASPQLADNEVNVYVKGNAIRLQLNDDLLARAYGNMGAEATATIFRAGRALNRYFSTIYTGYNPEFLLTNIIRDFTTGLANITGEEGVTMAMRAMKNYAGSFGSLLKYAATDKADKWVRMYREDGGNTGAAYLSDIERLGAEVKRDYAAYKGVLENLKSGDKAGAARAAGQKTFMRVLDIIRYMNEAGENAMRLSAYKAMIESGRTRAEAASLAKNSTVNFNRKGELGSQMNAAYLFFNAAVQGTAAIAHAHVKGKHKKQAWAVSSGMVALGYTMAMALGGGDDEDEYDQLPDFVKERNMVIKTDDGWATIPVPYGYGFFWSLGRHLADAQRTGKTDDLAWKIGASFVTEMTPFGGMVAGEEPDGLQAAVFALPTVAQITFAPIANLSSFGGPIMPTSMSDKTQPDRDRMWRGTRGTLADELSGALAEAGFDVSPESIKFQWRTFTGGAGTMVTSTIDAARLKAAGADLEVRETPFVRKLYKEADVRDTRSAYWSAVKEAEAVSEAFGRAKRANDTATMRQIATDDRELLALAKLANRWGKVVSAERDRIDAVRLSGLYTKAEERAIIKDMEKREREIYQRYLDIFKARTRPD